MEDREQLNLFETGAARTLLDQLLTDSRLYTQSKDYKELLDFVVRLRNFAPFNAMLLHVQKPGLSYAALERDWRDRFSRTIKEGARPLVILWPFGPVAFVYDVLNTQGKPLPEDVSPFIAHGLIDAKQLTSFIPRLKRKNIEWCWLDAGANPRVQSEFSSVLPITKNPPNTECISTVIICRQCNSRRWRMSWDTCS